MQAAGELLGALAHVAGGAVHVQRQADDEGVGLPFLDQGFDAAPVGNAVLRLEHAEFAGLAGNDLADGDADLLGAVIEAQQQAKVVAHAWPAWLPSRLRSTPSVAAAASSRCSAGSSNSRRGSLGQCSQVLSAISASSWPASQPA